MADIIITIKHAEDIVIPPLPAPGALTIICSALSTSSLRVGWTDAGNLAEYYVIEYGTSPSFTSVTTITNITATPGAGGFYDITGLNLLTTEYYVRMRAVNNGGVSAWDYYTFSPPTPDALINLVLTAIAGPAVKVEFDDPGMFAANYDIDISTSSGFVTYTRVTIPSNPMSHITHTFSAGIVAATTYYVRVRPINGLLINAFISGSVTT